MRVLVTGSTGLIGSSVVAHLSSAGREVIRVAHRSSPGTVSVNMADPRSAAAWPSLLNGVDAVVNCAGILQDSRRDSTKGVHHEGALAFFKACERAGVRRVVHFSAMGVDREQPSAFSSSKLAGDMALKELDLDWVILRPSVVVGRSAYGASALFRGLASLPILPVMPSTGDLQIVQLDEVVATVAHFLDAASANRVELELAGPQRLKMAEIIGAYRQWLGWRPARRLTVPAGIARLIYRLGDIASWFGWRPPLCTNAALEIVRGATGDPAQWTSLTGITPRSLEQSLAAEPPSVQEKWFAGLYVIKPFLFVVLPAFWIATAVISVTAGYDEGVDLMLAAGAGILTGPAVVAGALCDFIVGTMIAFRRTSRLGLLGALALSVFYVFAGTILRPDLWDDPLGPFLKIFPIIIVHAVALAILEDR